MNVMWDVSDTNQHSLSLSLSLYAVPLGLSSQNCLKAGELEDQGFLHNWVQHMDLGTLDDGEVLDDCENHTALVQRIYGMAVAKVSTSFQPLALQINTFKAYNAPQGA